MPIFQAYNPKTKAWVKYKKSGDRTQIVDVKQKEPKLKFKDVKVRGNRK